MELRLTIELVPVTAWHKSVYHVLKGKGKLDVWRRIKEEIFAKEGK